MILETNSDNQMVEMEHLDAVLFLSLAELVEIEMHDQYIRILKVTEKGHMVLREYRCYLANEKYSSPVMILDEQNFPLDIFLTAYEVIAHYQLPMHRFVECVKSHRRDYSGRKFISLFGL
ncbi:hypothetical protein HCA69_05655 [Listeria grandensis]|uniref:Uncharacterized protein n=1 Tax=Listeria grandensis TaxID=1494963 RepID=A0A7X1CPC0_9LIST|nr:hypothetical protein [Listeria grandensis]MBC1935844.1 hypothetical protein [Listeria grandensis]